MEVNSAYKQKHGGHQNVRTKNVQSPMVSAFLAGSFSGVCSTVLFQPLDLIKTRIQTQPDAGKLSMRGAGVMVIRNDGVLGLWRGLLPSLLRTVPGVGLYFGTAHSLRSHISTKDASTSLMIGFVSRSVACTAMIPVTVIKLRTESNCQKLIATGFSDIYKMEGIRGLTRGLLPTILRDAPFSGIYMMLYDSIKKSGKYFIH